jgi:aspartate dehydrogenase
VVGSVLARSQAGLRAGVRRIGTLEALLELEPAAVVEAAGIDAARQYAAPILSAGVDLILVSTGALLDSQFSKDVDVACRSGGAKLHTVSGAIAGLDALRAARFGRLDEVHVVQRKPAALLMSAEEALSLKAPLVVYEGLVEPAVRMYPRTANVLAAVALAGVGPERTTTSVVADPAATGNSVSVYARGAFGELSIELRNRPLGNPRSSMLAAMSVIECLCEIFEPGRELRAVYGRPSTPQ